MKLSARGLALIASFEGWRATPYSDAAGHATIGYGHLLHRGGVTAADRAKWGTISRARGLALLRADAADAEAAVRRVVKVPLTQGQFDALVSFTFNLGGGALADSTLLRKLNKRDYMGALGEFGKWVKAGGRTLLGLVRRRRAEAALFASHPANPFAVLTVTERRLVLELDRRRKLPFAGANARRRRVLVAELTRRRKAIWRAAQSTGWGHGNRRARYRVLLSRTH